MTSKIKVDTIEEKTSANGVTIDSLAIKDGKLTNLMNSTLSAADLGGGVHIKASDSGASANASHDELVIENSGNSGISILSGTSSAGAICFGDSDNNCIAYINASHANNTLEFATNNAERMRIDSAGNLLVGRSDNPSGVSNCVYALGNHGITTGSGANVFINSEGLFFRSTSSERYKNTIQDATHGLTELLTLRSVTFKNNEDGDKIYGGLIAEEVHEAGLTEFVQYNDDNEPDALDYGNIVSLCIKAIQEQQTKIQELEARITELENAE